MYAAKPPNNYRSHLLGSFSGSFSGSLSGSVSVTFLGPLVGHRVGDLISQLSCHVTAIDVFYHGKFDEVFVGMDAEIQQRKSRMQADREMEANRFGGRRRQIIAKSLGVVFHPVCLFPSCFPEFVF